MKKANAAKSKKTNSKTKTTKKVKPKSKQKSKTNSLAVASDAIAKVDIKPREVKKSEEIMDRPTLIGLARLLKGAGADVKALKSDTDAALQKKINEAIQQLPDAEIVKQLEAIDPNKLVNALKLDCFGIFVDFSDASCVRCVDAKSCVAKFITNVQGGFPHLKGAATAATEEKVIETKSLVPPISRYEEGRLVFVRDVKNPNPEGDDYHDTIQRILDEQPETLGELRKIVESEFTIDGDGDFMKFVTALRDHKEGVIKLDADLSDKDKAVLRKAGYDV